MSQSGISWKVAGKRRAHRVRDCIMARCEAVSPHLASGSLFLCAEDGERGRPAFDAGHFLHDDQLCLEESGDKSAGQII